MSAKNGDLQLVLLLVTVTRAVPGFVYACAVPKARSHNKMLCAIAVNYCECNASGVDSANNAPAPFPMDIDVK